MIGCAVGTISASSYAKVTISEIEEKYIYSLFKKINKLLCTCIP